MKIGILQTGNALQQLQQRHGDFDRLFQDLLAEHGFTFETFSVNDGVFPGSVQACDGWLITGSRHSSYEGLDWMVQLETFLRAAYEAEIPIVGICFGHQILAQALGGQVERFPGGWSIGPQEYLFDGISDPVVINAWHQDQVTVLPAGSTRVATSPFCENAALVYGDRAFTIQAHPELHNAFTSDLIEARRDILAPELVAEAEKRLKTHTPSPVVVEQMAAFFKNRALPAGMR